MEKTAYSKTVEGGKERNILQTAISSICIKNETGTATTSQPNSTEQTKATKEDQ